MALVSVRPRRRSYSILENGCISVYNTADRNTESYLVLDIDCEQGLHIYKLRKRNPKNDREREGNGICCVRAKRR